MPLFKRYNKIGRELTLNPESILGLGMQLTRLSLDVSERHRHLVSSIATATSTSPNVQLIIPNLKMHSEVFRGEESARVEGWGGRNQHQFTK
jgi:hypothetical protein